MTIRFTDKDKFRDKWYMGLTPLQKCIWEYFVSECNHAGLLELNLPMMSVQINCEVSQEDIDYFIREKRAFWVTEDKLFIPRFILFQQRIKVLSELNPKNRCHKSIIEELKKYDLWGENGINRSLLRVSEGASKPLSKPETIDITEQLSPYEAPKKELNRGISNCISNSNSKSNSKGNDIYSNTEFEYYFKTYSEYKNLVPLRFEKRSKSILELLQDFLNETDYNHEYFKEVCEKANSLKTIIDTRIDFKMLLKNHAGIVSGKYERASKSVHDYKY